MSKTINANLLNKYLKIRDKREELEAEEVILKSKIVDDFQKNNVEKLDDPSLGSFTIGHRVTYEFSDAVRKLEEKVKIAKTKEQQKGTAKVKSDTAYLLYKEPKINE